MEVILSPRRSGKTTRLIEQCAKDGGYIVSISHAEAYRVAQRAREMGLSIPFPLTPPEFVGKHYHGKVIKWFYIDNADMFLQSLTTIPIATITLTDR